MSGPTRMAVIANGAFSLVNFRGPLIAEMVRRGMTVFALAPDYDDALRTAVRSLGAEPVDISLDRFSIRPLRDLAAMLQLSALLRQLRIDASFSYFLKPVVFGTLAAWLAGVPRRYAMIAGLGYLFTETAGREGAVKPFLRAVLVAALRIALRRATKVFFQNRDDQVQMTRRCRLDADRTVALEGTGIDLAHFRFTPLPTGPVRFLFVGRLLREKGLPELIEAAQLLHGWRIPCTVAVAGAADDNPGALTREELRRLDSAGICEWLGHVADVRGELERATVFVLPSHREGKPRSTQEALAVGRPVITTDAIGCRDTVVAGESGWIVPVNAPTALAEAMRDACRDVERLAAMGRASRALAENRFDVNRINETMLAQMGIGSRSPGAVCPEANRAGLQIAEGRS